MKIASEPLTEALLLWGIPKVSGPFRIFFIFFARGGGIGSPRRRGGGGVGRNRFFIEIPGF